MVEKSNSGMIQSEIHLWKFILEFDTEFPNEFVLARSDLHVEGNESRVEQKMTMMGIEPEHRGSPGRRFSSQPSADKSSATQVKI